MQIRKAQNNMLSVILAIISAAVAVTLIRLFIYQDEKSDVIKGHTLFIYGPRCGYTDIISDMLARFANNELCNSNLTTWKVLHQSDYHRPEYIVKMIPQCCGVVNYNPVNDPTNTQYYNYVNYENKKSLDLRGLISDIQSYTNRGINVIVEGHIYLEEIPCGTPIICVTQSNNSLAKSSKFRASISEYSDGDDEIRHKIIEKYVNPSQQECRTNLYGTDNTVFVYCENIDDNQFNVINELYLAIKNIFIKVRKQDDIREGDTAYVHPIIL